MKGSSYSLRYHPHICMEEMRKIMGEGNLSKDSQSLDQDLYIKHETECLLLTHDIQSFPE